MKLISGDCSSELKQLESNSIDSLITDPPAGIAFMGKEWDEDKGGSKEWIEWMTGVMKECLRVLKPGAHGLVWAIPRTSHWTATALEDAGFEVRDVITHIFGSGFPKSLDISKAIDKAAGAKRETISTRKLRGKARVLKGNNFDGGYEGKELNTEYNITAPSTSEAKQWSGWGTALKPASEHWILVRKPISEDTIADNVLKYGTGGLNIDASRIEAGSDYWEQEGQSQGGKTRYTQDGSNHTRSTIFKPASGRFPANLIVDESAVEELDEQSGILQKRGNKNPTMLGGGLYGHGTFIGVGYTDDQPLGGASRFFYCAKASAKDKGSDNTHPTVKSTKLMEYLIKLITPIGGVVLDPFTGSGSTGVAAKCLDFQFIGIEKEPEYFEIAEKRINEIIKWKAEQKVQLALL